MSLDDLMKSISFTLLSPIIPIVALLLAACNINATATITPTAMIASTATITLTPKDTSTPFVMPATWTKEPTATRRPTQTATVKPDVTPTRLFTLKAYKSPRPTVDPIKAYNQAVQAYNAAISACPNAYQQANHNNYIDYLNSVYSAQIARDKDLVHQAMGNGNALIYADALHILKQAEADYQNAIDQENASYANLCK